MKDDIDYKALCWNLVDKMNAAWKRSTGSNKLNYSFEFNHANAYYMYSSGFVAQIVELNCLGCIHAIVCSRIGGLFVKGCDTPEEAFKSIEDYLKKVNDNSKFYGLDTKYLPKTIKEIAA